MSSPNLKPPVTRAVAAITAVAVIAMAALGAVLAVIAARDTCSTMGVEQAPSGDAKRGIPARYMSLYRQAARESGVPWPALAAIGSIETDHGRSRAPGVRSGLNRHGCCAGPMQFNTRDGPPSTWKRYGIDANHDGVSDVYDSADAIPSAATYLRALLRGADGILGQAILGYNHPPAYVRDVLARARACARANAAELTTPVDETIALSDCADGGLDVMTGPANLHDSRRVASPRAFRILPRWAMAGATALERSTRASTTTWSGSCAATTCASPPPERAATTPTVTAPPSTSSPPTETHRRSGTPPPDASPTSSAGRRRVRAQGRGRHVGSRRRSSSSAMTATPATARRAPAAVGAPRTCTSPGPRSATAQAGTLGTAGIGDRHTAAPAMRASAVSLGEQSGRCTGKCNCVPGLLGLSL